MSDAFDFDEAIVKFNELYKLPTRQAPGLPFVATADASVKTQFKDRMLNFKDILLEEINEVHEILAKIEAGDSPVEILADLADWLGDIQVYCASEMAKFGIPNSMVLSIIMASNMSKLGKDGKPVYDERGKVKKGPDYWAPEPMLQRFITAAARQANKQTT